MRKCISILLLLCLTLSLCACHGGKQYKAYKLTKDFDTETQYEITFWSKNETNKRQVQVYKDAIAAFEKLYPNIKVNMKLYTDYSRIYQDVITNMATDTTPNVCITYPDHIATYLEATNSVVALDELMTDEKYGLGGSQVAFDAPTMEQIVPEFLEEGKISGHYYALPYMRSTEACYINKDYVEKLGFTLPEILTWDFIWEVSQAALAKNPDGTFQINGQKVMYPVIYKSTDNMMIQMLAQQNAPYSTDKGEIQLFSKETKSLLKSLVPHVKSGELETFKRVSYPANFLNRGQCIFAIDSTAGATWMGYGAPLGESQTVEFETEVRPAPQMDAENPKMISQGPSVCIFNKEDPQEVLASWLFVQFLLTNQVQLAYSQTEGYLPVTLKAQESKEYQDYLSRSGEDNETYFHVKIDAVKMLQKYTENTFVTPVFNGSASLRNAAGDMIEETVSGVKRKQTINDAFVDKLYKDMVAKYQLDSVSAVSSDANTDVLDSETVIGKTRRPVLGAMPTASKLLIAGLCVTWVILGAVATVQGIKKKNRN